MRLAKYFLIKGKLKCHAIFIFLILRSFKVLKNFIIIPAQWLDKTYLGLIVKSRY